MLKQKAKINIDKFEIMKYSLQKLFHYFFPKQIKSNFEGIQHNFRKNF